jgi:hypothetical protein
VLDLHPDPGYEWYGKLGETSFAVGQFAGQALGGVANLARTYSMSASRGCNQALLGKCFIAGTAIQMADGTTKAIEQVQVGDKVLSLNIKTGKVEEKSVLKTYIREAEHLHAISVGNETLYTTDGHPFLTSHGYVNAEDLTTGTSLVTRITQPTPTTSLATPVGGGVNWNGTSVSFNEKFDQPSIFFGHKGGNGYAVYNFEVEDNHNYFVGKENGGICVHNADDYEPGPGIRLPDENGVPGGKWSGVKGDSQFTPGGGAYKGIGVEFKKGHPQFGPHLPETVKGPNGIDIHSELEVPGLIGSKSSAHKALTAKYLVEKYPDAFKTQEIAKQWMSTNDFRPHHAIINGNRRIQLVPGELHALRHSGPEFH